MNVSIVIPCLNAGQTLGETLAAVTAQKWDHPWEIVIADNGSSDNSKLIVAEFQKRFDGLRLVDASKRRGTPFAVNTGVAAARGRSILFCDADDVPAHGWLATMGNALESNPFVAARMDLHKLNSPIVSNAHHNAQASKLQRIPYPPYLYHAGGGTIGVWRTLFLKVGGYNESLVYLHDTDFCFKVQLAGEPLRFVSDAVIHIRYRMDLSNIFKQSRKWAAYNLLLAKMYRHYGMLKPHYWQRHFRNTKSALNTLLKWHRLSRADRFHAAWQIGWCLGIWEGIVRFQARPY
jgi:glycosyltransferase involved in cell wall biosynthesis